MRRTKEEAEHTRQQLLEAAMHVICDKGFNALRLSDVADRVGMTRGAIYWHFGNRKELLIALFKNRVDPSFEIIDQVMDEPIPSIEKLEKLLIAFLEKLKKDKDFLENQHLDFMDSNLRHDIPEIDAYFYKRGKTLFNKIIQIIETGIKEGEIRPVDPQALSSLVGAIMSGFTNMYIKKSTDFIFVDEPDVLVDIFINGIKANENSKLQKQV